MSQKSYSLALDELKDSNIDSSDNQKFEPQLKVLIKSKYVKDSVSNESTEPVKIRGRITVSF